MAIRASLSSDRQERSIGRAPRFRQFFGAISKIDADDRRRRAITRRTSKAGWRNEDRQTRFIYRLYFAGPTARQLLCVTYFPASERNRACRKSGGNSKFNAGSDGERTPGFRNPAWWDPRS